MNCKDCIHYDVCKDDYNCGYLFKDENGNYFTDDCQHFKSKADFAEVVRCPECIYCENMKCSELKDNSGHPLDVAIFDYCSQGVRK